MVPYDVKLLIRDFFVFPHSVVVEPANNPARGRERDRYDDRYGGRRGGGGGRGGGGFSEK